MNLAVLTGRPVLRQMVRFGVVGVANTVLCLAIVWTLRDSFGWPVWLASGAGYAISIGQSYLLNRNWTFAGGAALPAGPQLVRFIGVNIVMGLIFSGLTSLLAPTFGVRPASLLALVPVTVMSFLASRRFVFGKSA